jgi:hypothetical protein
MTVRDGSARPDRGAVGEELSAILVCIGALQVTFYVFLRDLPFQVIAPRTVRLLVADAVVIAGGWVFYRVLLGAANLAPASIVPRQERSSPRARSSACCSRAGSTRRSERQR